ncbi:MAG: hypothetical protein E7B11_28645 [Clostridiales bacterium]|nr:hypothetical protein [Clostridiales bacterium]
MKTVIYYFSATGNSLHTARIIGDKLNAELIPMPGHMGVTSTGVNTVWLVLTGARGKQFNGGELPGKETGITIRKWG